MDIETQIQNFAKQRRIKPQDYEEFRNTILKGLRAMRLKTDSIEEEKYIRIANMKDAQALAKKQEVEQCQSKGKEQ